MKLVIIVLIIVIKMLPISAKFERPVNCGKSLIITENKVNNIEIVEESDDNINEFIVGGTNARIGKVFDAGSDSTLSEFPFMVSIQLRLGTHEKLFDRDITKDKHFCGGSILNNRWILTAAHCFSALEFFLDLSPDMVKVIVGTIDISSNGKSNGSKEYAVEKWITNGCFSMRSVSDDICLLKTTSDIDLNNNTIGAVCLPPINSEPISTDVYIMGWGVWSQTSIFVTEGMPDILQKAKSQIISEEYCLLYNWYRNLGVFSWSTGKKICTQSANSTGCRGDSGGPLIQIVNGKMYQLGIASHISAAMLDNTCYDTNPILFTKLSNYIEWIDSSIEAFDNSSQKKIQTKC